MTLLKISSERSCGTVKEQFLVSDMRLVTIGDFMSAEPNDDSDNLMGC